MTCTLDSRLLTNEYPPCTSFFDCPGKGVYLDRGYVEVHKSAALQRGSSPHPAGGRTRRSWWRVQSAPPPCRTPPAGEHKTTTKAFGLQPLANPNVMRSLDRPPKPPRSAGKKAAQNGEGPPRNPQCRAWRYIELCTVFEESLLSAS